MYKVWVLGVYADTGTTHIFPVIEEFDSWNDIGKILEYTLDKWGTHTPTKRLFIKDAEGNRSTFKLLAKPDYFGFASANREWVEYNLAWEDVKLRRNPDPCARCFGNGVVEFGKVTVRDRGRSIRICFACKGRGFSA